MDHVKRAIGESQGLGLTPIAPTVVLESSASPEAAQALAMAADATSLAEKIGLAIVGTGSFWSQGRLLDDYVGQVAQLRPSVVMLTVMRSQLDYPPAAGRAEVSGLCRSVYSLSRRTEVIVQHSDLFGLPALAAGATAIGTGWDLRQRIAAETAYIAATRILRSGQRVTYRSLYGALRRRPAEALYARNRVLSDQLVPGPLPLGPLGHWEHHIGTLDLLATAATFQPQPRDRVVGLRAAYAAALAEFGRVDRLIQPRSPAAASWIQPVDAGLGDFASGEGW